MLIIYTLWHGITWVDDTVLNSGAWGFQKARSAPFSRFIYYTFSEYRYSQTKAASCLVTSPNLLPKDWAQFLQHGLEPFIRWPFILVGLDTTRGAEFLHLCQRHQFHLTVMLAVFGPVVWSWRPNQLVLHLPVAVAQLVGIVRCFLGEEMDQWCKRCTIEGVCK